MHNFFKRSWRKLFDLVNAGFGFHESVILPNLFCNQASSDSLQSENPLSTILTLAPLAEFFPYPSRRITIASEYDDRQADRIAGRKSSGPSDLVHDAHSTQIGERLPGVLKRPSIR